MEKRQHALRCIVLKLNVSGTCEVLEEQRLYKGSYGFIKLQVYVPKTQNTEAPILTAFCTTRDELGREVVSTENHRLCYVDEIALGGFEYLLFECLLPKEFTEKATVPDGLKVTFNYCDSTPILDEHGTVLTDGNGVPKRRATDLLVSSRYITTVYEGGWNDESRELDIDSAEAAQIAENMRNIAELQADVSGFHNELDESMNAITAERERAEAAADTAASDVLRQVTEQKESAIQKIEETCTDAQETIAEKIGTVRDELNAIKDKAETAQKGAEDARDAAARSEEEAEAQKSEATRQAEEAARLAAEALASAASAEKFAARAEDAAKYGIRINTDFTSVDALPRPGNPQFIYLIPNGSSSPNAFDEYIWSAESGDGEYEKIGTTEIDLTAYLTKESAAQTYATKLEAETAQKTAEGSVQPDDLKSYYTKSETDNQINTAIENAITKVLNTPV